MVNLCLFEHLGPFGAHLDPFRPFQTKMNFLPPMDKVGFGRGASGQKINLCLKWFKGVQTTHEIPDLFGYGSVAIVSQKNCGCGCDNRTTKNDDAVCGSVAILCKKKVARCSKIIA